MRFCAAKRIADPIKKADALRCQKRCVALRDNTSYG
jgi:hypothetical protein